MSIITDHWFEDNPNYMKDGDDWVNIAETFNTHQRPIKKSEMTKGKINMEKESSNMNAEEIVEKIAKDLGFQTIETGEPSEVSIIESLKDKINALEIAALEKDRQLKEITTQYEQCHLDSVDDDFGIKENYITEGVVNISAGNSHFINTRRRYTLVGSDYSQQE